MMFATLALMASPGAARAAGDVPGAQRWLIGLDIAATTLSTNAQADGIIIDAKAAGPALQVGWLWKPCLMVRAAAGAADYGTNLPDVKIRVGGGTIDAVFLFREGRTFRPYLFAGVGGYEALSRRDNLAYAVSGTGLAFGTGAHLRLGRDVTLHGSVRVESVRWPETAVTLDGPDGPVPVAEPIDRDGWGSRVMIGLGWWP